MSETEEYQDDMEELENDYVEGQFDDVEESNHDEPAMFTPRLSIQRFEYVMTQLRFHSDDRLRSVIDLGCGELASIKYLRHVATVEKIACIEINREELESRLFLLKPLISDYFSNNRREKDLVTEAYCGSIIDRDSRLLNYQAAILVEVIEHLNIEQLEPMAATLFGYYCPKIVVVTTPNADFNVLFKDFDGMRHWDHKFEWTRVEFLDWAYGIAKQYRYSVDIGGVGEDPDGNTELGFCTQVATFTKCDEFEEDIEEIEVVTCEPYVKLTETLFPAREPIDEDQRRSDLIFNICHSARLSNEQNPDLVYELIDLVPLSFLMEDELICEFCSNIDDLKNELSKADYSLSEDELHVVVLLYENDTINDLDQIEDYEQRNSADEGDAEVGEIENWDEEGSVHNEIWSSDIEDNNGYQELDEDVIR